MSFLQPKGATIGILKDGSTIQEFVDSTTKNLTDLQTEVTAIPAQVKADADAAQEAADRAEAIVDIEGTYPDIAAGLAATTNGDYFRVPQGSKSDVSFKYYLNNSGTASEVAWLLGAQKFFDFLNLFNSMFMTTGTGGFDVIFRNKIGQISGGIDTAGALNFGKIIANLSQFASAEIKQLTANSITLSNQSGITDQLPVGLVWAVMNAYKQAVAGVKDDGTFSVGKLEAFHANIEQLISNVTFSGGVKTSQVTPEGYVYAIMNEFYQMVFGIKEDGSTEVGSLRANKIYADQIDSPSISISKKPIVKHLPDMIHILIYGQSLSTGINALPLQTTTSIGNAWKFVAGVRAQDGSGTPDENHATIIPYTETQHDTGDGVGYETPMGGTITAILDRLKADASNYTEGDIQCLGSAPGQGGRTIDQLRSGTYMNRVQSDLSNGILRANEKGWTYDVHAAIWMQGESDQTAGTTKDHYIDSFDKLVTQINGYASAALGRTVTIPWFTYQFNSWKNRVPNTSYPTIPLALLELARTRDDVRLVQPMYMYDYHDTAHLLGPDSKICGYRYGLAIQKEIMTGEKFEPLWSKAVELQNGIVNVWYNAVGNLVLDTSLVSDPGNYGFSVIDPSGNDLTISEVSVHGNRLRIRATTKILPGSKLRVGFVGGVTGQLPDKTHGPRCCLRDSQGDTIKYTLDGITYRMDNYAVIEEITLN